MAKVDAEPFPPEGTEPLSGARRELDEVTLQVAGVSDPVEASELVDALYAWLPKYTEERAEVEDMAVAGRQSRSGGSRLRNIVDQVMVTIDPTPPWLSEIDALWPVFDLPDEAADTSGQASLFGVDGNVELPTDVRFGDQWVRFDSEAQADYVRVLAAVRMAPRRIAVPPAGIASSLEPRVLAFVEAKQAELRDALSERIDRKDPNYPDAFVQALSRLSASVRTTLHAASD